MEAAQQSTESGTGLEGKVAHIASDARRTLSGAADSVRARTGNLQAQLADALESGAGALRERAASLGPTAQGDGAESGPGTGSVVDQALPRLAAQGELAAGLMERGAMWLRENDLSDLEGRVLGQLEEHPVRTLGIAMALGFLVAGRRK